MFTGQSLGRGASRYVFDCPLMKNSVVKYEIGTRSFCNQAEWDIWNNLSDHKVLGQWLAPIYHISPCGIILVQAKTTPVPRDQMPKMIPRFFTDTKYQNWGWFEGRVVCHDYANNRLYSDGSLGRLVKASWWDANGDETF
jgi:hypothetical protein